MKINATEIVARYKAVVFDMDGTIVDSIGVWNEVDRRLIVALGGTPLSETANQARRDAVLARVSTAKNPYLAYCHELVQACGSSLSDEEVLAKRLGIAHELLEKDVDYKPGMVDLIRQLRAKGVRLAIASTTNAGNMAIYRLRNERLRSQLLLDDTFEFILTRDAVKRLKPHPEIFELALEKLALPPADVLVIEDALVGVIAAKAAGLAVAATYDRYSDKDRRAIEDLSDYLLYNRTRRIPRLYTFGENSLTLSGWADRLGVSVSVLRKRLGCGWPLERVLTEAKAQIHKPVRLTYNGETLTLREWSERTGLPITLIRKRIEHNWTADRILGTPHHETRKIDWRGKSMTLTEWAHELGIRRVVLQKRLEAGWTIDSALSTPLLRIHQRKINPTPKPPPPPIAS